MTKKAPATAGCDEHDPSLLTVEQVHEKLAELASPVEGHERLAIRSALNRVLAEDIISPMNVPPHANSAMDGYAVCAADFPTEGETELKVIGTSWAGDPFSGNMAQGECVRIMTGAQIPTGSDSVIMQEQVHREGDLIRIGTDHQAGQNVRHPGEDIAKGGVVLAKGKKITAVEIGLLASLGIPEVTVYRRVRVAFFSTGDELRGVGESLEEGQIYDSNRYTLYGMLQRLGVELVDMGVIRDNKADIEHAFNNAADIADVVITSGGVSVGEADFVKMTLDKIGQVDFWRIAMKPGKPLALGKIKQARFFGLPGNPVSVMATFYLFALPAIRRMMGQAYTQPIRVNATTQTALKKRPGRTDYQRAVLSNDNGQLVVNATGMQASHILSGMSQANCFVVLDKDAGNIEAGETVSVIPFYGLMD